jgi:hypothetical protein
MKRTVSTVSGQVNAIAEKTLDAQGRRSSFRIGNRPAYSYLTFNITDGDTIMAAGYDEPEFEVLGLHNKTTNVIYSIEQSPAKVNIFLVLFGIFSAPLLIGLVILWLLWKRHQMEAEKYNVACQVKQLLNKK